MIQTNYLIIGSGIAGLTFALKIAEKFPDKKVTIITKANADESNTKYAQGGIAVVTDKLVDSYDKHIKDTIICGDGLCDEDIVKMVITEGPKRLKELIEWGAKFDKNATGTFSLGKEGGHSENRVLHHKDQTGQEIQRAISFQVHQKENISVLDYHLAIDLITNHNRCLGAFVLNEKTNEVLTFKTDFTLLATGGIGHLYGHTTNPVIATGDGIAMAHRAGAKIKEMEFIQFHPTALYDASTGTSFLISEAVRGFGAYLRTKIGHRFMPDYDSRGDLASRDIVSQCIDIELKKSNDDCVYLDCTHLDMDGFTKHFPMIYERCKSIGIDLSKDWIPVVPAQHYLCGGIVVDKTGKTSIDRLFACGECSRTGLHGANRLASNSLLEALVYSDKIFNCLTKADSKDNKIDKTVFDWKLVPKPAINQTDVADIKGALQFLMRQNVGIVRRDVDLDKAHQKLIQWKKQVEGNIRNYAISANLYELQNLITIGILIVEQSIERKQNCGGFVKVN